MIELKRKYGNLFLEQSLLYSIVKIYITIKDFFG
jgi:hypothetical protein